MPLPTPQDAAQLAALKDQANALWAALSYQIGERDRGRRQHMFDAMNPSLRGGASRGVHKATPTYDGGETAAHLRLYAGNTPGRTWGAPEPTVRKAGCTSCGDAAPPTAVIDAHDPARVKPQASHPGLPTAEDIAHLKTLAAAARTALEQIRGLRAGAHPAAGQLA